MAVSPAYGRNPAGQRIVGSGHSATLPVPDTVALIAIGSPTRPFGGSSVSSSASPCPATGGPAGRRPAGRGSTVTGTVSLRSEYRSSRLKSENPTGTAYATVAGGITIRPGASGNSAWWATNRSIQPPRTCRDAATSVGTAPEYDHAPSAVWIDRIGASGYTGPHARR